MEPTHTDSWAVVKTGVSGRPEQKGDLTYVLGGSLSL